MKVIDKMIDNFKISDLFKEKEIAIFSHIYPDGDTIGAQVALAEIFKGNGVEVSLYNMSGRPELFNFLELSREIRTFDNTKDHLPKYTICVDSGSIERVGLGRETFNDTTLISIDHHQGNTLFGDINYIDDLSPATCQIIAEIAFRENIIISEKAATALFTGISTDTGSFKYEQVSGKTFQLASWLMEMGANHHLVRLNIYENISYAKFKLIKKIYDATEFYYNNKLAIATVSFRDIESLNVLDDEFHGVVSLIKEIEGVELAVFVRGLNNGKIKLSFRSKRYVDVNQLATFFGGGGHIRAAGSTLFGNIDEVKNEILSKCEDIFND